MRTEETNMSKKVMLGCLGVLVVVVLILGIWLMGTYNSLVSLDQKTTSQWAQVENVYQRRADLVPNLVETVKGAAAFEKDTFTAGDRGPRQGRPDPGWRNKSGQRSRRPSPSSSRPRTVLSSALSRLMVVVEKYPDLKATQNFRDLQVQLEGTENRIAVERMRFNEAAQAFNTKRMSFPTVIIAGFFGARASRKRRISRPRPGPKPRPRSNSSQ